MADVVDACLTLSSSKYFRIRSGSLTSSSPSNMAADSCRRCLFGRPDAEEVRRDLELIRDRQLRHSVQRWNYDFVSGRPLPGRMDWGVTADEQENCGRVEDRHDGGQMGGGRLELLEYSPDSVQSASTAVTTTNPPTQQNVTMTVSAVDAPRVPAVVPPGGGAGRKRRRSSARTDAVGVGPKQSRHPRRRRAVVGRRSRRPVNTAGAARVTGQYIHNSLCGVTGHFGPRSEVSGYPMLISSAAQLRL